MANFRIGRLYGIPVEIDVTLLLILPVFAWLIGSQVELWVGLLGILPDATVGGRSLTTGAIPWVLGLACAVGLFGGILLHELGHSVVAMHYGFEIESIRLWLLGGVARFTEMPEDWRQEFAVAVAGPLVSILLGILSYGVFVVLPSTLGAVQFVVGYLALMNVTLAAFNLLPGFPMDGGRVLRALLARNRPHARATQLAATVGKIFAVGLGLLGLFAFNLILIAVALFIYMGASGEAQQATLKVAFEGVTVRDIMTPAEDIDTVREERSVADLLDRMLRERHVGYPVMRNGTLVGMVTLDDTRSVREVERDAYRVGDIMDDDYSTVSPTDSVMDALAVMQRTGSGHIPVITDQDEFVGLLSRTDLVMAFNVSRAGGSIGPLRLRELPTREPR